MPSEHADPALPTARARLDESLLARPISPASFDLGLGIYALGSSGFVQMAPASEGTNVVAEGQFPSSGEMMTVPGGYPGDVMFDGLLQVGPDELPAGQTYDPTIDYFWLRNWKYLIPFPPPSGLSLLTYRFNVYAFFGINFPGGHGNVMSFVSLGETPNLTTGTNVTIGIDAGWPLVADLNQQTPSYNGHYGYIDGQLTVQRSFMVGAGHVPGVAVIVGAVCGLAMGSEVALYFPGAGYSNIGISSPDPVSRTAYSIGRVEYSYEPRLVVAEQ